MAVEGQMQPDGKSALFTPALEGVTAEVQHSVQSGKPFTAERGMVGVGVVLRPDGQPRLVLQVRHPDGTSLGVIMVAEEAITLIQCMTDAMLEAAGKARAVETAVRQ